MSFEQRLSENAELVERQLENLCAHLQADAVPARLVSALKHALLAGGKRFRPFLVRETAALFDVPESTALEVGLAIECIHSYSLVHDDLPSMDNDEMRRGRPTVWRQFDEWTAILAGDALQALAFERLAHERASPDPAIRARLVGGLAIASGGAGMVGGQALDLAAHKLQSPTNPTPEHIRKLQAMKTGALIRFSCEAGAILAGRQPGDDAYDRLATFGEHLGYAFQISDDLLDAEGDAATMGKAVAKDATAGKATLVASMGVERARRVLKEVHETAIDALSAFGSSANTLRQATDFVANRQH